MWLAERPNVTPGRARAWYTHVMAESVKRRLRRFTGRVSATAARAGARELRLEHFLRLQTTLSDLVARHKTYARLRPAEFIQTIVEFEQVHIVTREENYAAMRANGDYRAAGIRLLLWRSLPRERQLELWRTMLRGKVANATDYRPSKLR